jgi:hypothetical protein
LGKNLILEIKRLKASRGEDEFLSIVFGSLKTTCSLSILPPLGAAQFFKL